MNLDSTPASIVDGFFKVSGGKFNDVEGSHVWLSWSGRLNIGSRRILRYIHEIHNDTMMHHVRN